MRPEGDMKRAMYVWTNRMHMTNYKNRLQTYYQKPTGAIELILTPLCTHSSDRDFVRLSTPERAAPE